MDQVTVPRATMQQALEALEGGRDSWRLIGPAIDALRAALAQPRQFTFAPKPPSPPPAPQGYDGTEAGLQPFSWRGNE